MRLYMMFRHNITIPAAVFRIEMRPEMINADSIIRCIIAFSACFTISLIINIIIHETGHLMFGAVSGYRFSSIECFGMVCVRTGKGLKLRFSKEPCIGQCIMYPENSDADGTMLIIGGIAANMLVSAMSLGLVFTQVNYTLKAFFTVSAVVGLITAMSNLIPYNGTNDGSTFFDARKSFLHMEAYNRLMMIYRELNLGKDICSIDPGLFEHPDMPLSPLSAELAYYRNLRKRPDRAEE